MERIINAVKKDNSRRKLKTITETFSAAVNEIDNPRTWEIDYPLREVLFTALVAVCCGSESYYDFETLPKITDGRCHFCPASAVGSPARIPLRLSVSSEGQWSMPNTTL